MDQGESAVMALLTIKGMGENDKPKGSRKRKKSSTKSTGGKNKKVFHSS